MKSLWSWLLIALGIRMSAQETTIIRIDSQRTIQQIRNFPSAFVKARNIDLYLPESYDSNKKYKVVYFQDGQNLFNPSTAFQNEVLDLDLALKKNDIQDLIVVGIWNTEERYREYLPNEIYNSLHRKNRKWIRREYHGDAKGDLYLRFVMEELMPFVESKFSISSSKNDRYIAGISMGGLISFYAAMKYPEIFSGAICLSTHWPLSVVHDRSSIFDSYSSSLEKYISLLSSSRFYFDHGTDNIDAWYSPYQSKIDKLMKELGKVNDTNFKSLIFQNAGHNMKDWKFRIDTPLKFIFKTN